jgi:hypothetical protein
VRTRGQDGIVVSYGGRRRKFQPCPHPVRLRVLSTSRPLRDCLKASASRSCSASRRHDSCSACIRCSAFFRHRTLAMLQLVICTARIGADDKSRPASPVTLKSAGRGASAIHGGPRVLYLARPARSAELPEHRVAPSPGPSGGQRAQEHQPVDF